MSNDDPLVSLLCSFVELESDQKFKDLYALYVHIGVIVVSITTSQRSYRHFLLWTVMQVYVILRLRAVIPEVVSRGSLEG